MKSERRRLAFWTGLATILLFVQYGCGQTPPAGATGQQAQVQKAALVVYDRQGSVYAVDADGGNEQLILEEGEIEGRKYTYSLPTWSPDGGKLTSVSSSSTAGPELENATLECAIWTCDAAGGERKRVWTSGESSIDQGGWVDVVYLEWSEDGSQIGFKTMLGTWEEIPPDEECFILDLADGSVKEVTPTLFESSFRPRRKLHTDLSPDGTARLEARTVSGLDELFVTAAGGPAKRITQTGTFRDVSVAEDWGAAPISGAWSPDGKRVIFVAMTTSGDNAYDPLFAVRPDGTGQMQLSKGVLPLTDMPTGWSSTGAELAWVEEADIYITDFVNKPERLVKGTNPDWRPVPEGATEPGFDLTGLPETLLADKYPEANISLWHGWAIVRESPTDDGDMPAQLMQWEDGEWKQVASSREGFFYAHSIIEYIPDLTPEGRKALGLFD